MPAKSTFGSASVIPYSTVSDSYNIGQSLRFNSADSTTLYWNDTVGGFTAYFTYSFWIKRSALASAQIVISAGTSSANFGQIGFDASDRLAFYENVGGVIQSNILTSAVFRDPSAWYHIVFVHDSREVTSTNRIKFYVNGVQQTISGTYPNINVGSYLAFVAHKYIGGQGYGVAPSGSYFNGYLAEIYYINGNVLTPSAFGQTDVITGVWNPKRYTYGYTSPDYYLNFINSSGTTSTTLGKDSSGNNNNWTPNNFTVSPLSAAACDIVVDSPTNYGTDTGLGGEVRGNYNTLNPISPVRGTIIDGNLRTNGGDRGSISTIAMTKGKWYCEMVVTAVGAESSVGLSNGINAMNTYVGSSVDSWGYYFNGTKYTNGVGLAYGASYTTGDVVGCTFDADNGILGFYKNGKFQGTAYTGLTSIPYYFAASGRTSTAANDVSMNFGQKPWTYILPASASGFKALCSTNLFTPTLKKSKTGFDAITYTGTGTTFVSPSALAFAPDLVWVKSRSQAINHVLSDTVRGAGEVLVTNTDSLSSSNVFLSSFNQNGFTLNSSITANNSGSTYVAWCWKAGGQTQTNTVGTITSQVNADPSRGFSVVSYTGTGANATVGHGLTTSPKFLIVKSRQTTGRSWNVWHTGLTGTEYLILELTDLKATDATKWNSAIPSASVFNLGTAAGTNTSGEKYIAYCWSEVEGFSKFGSWTGNSSADGPFLWCGFRPRWIMWKTSAGTIANWNIVDATRNTFNQADALLLASSSNAESTAYGSYYVDFCSNGFKIRGSGGGFNATGDVVAFAAFSESPFKYARAR